MPNRAKYGYNDKGIIFNTLKLFAVLLAFSDQSAFGSQTELRQAAPPALEQITAQGCSSLISPELPTEPRQTLLRIEATLDRLEDRFSHAMAASATLSMYIDRHSEISKSFSSASKQLQALGLRLSQLVSKNRNLEFITPQIAEWQFKLADLQGLLEKMSDADAEFRRIQTDLHEAQDIKKYVRDLMDLEVQYKSLPGSAPTMLRIEQMRRSLDFAYHSASGDSRDFAGLMFEESNRQRESLNQMMSHLQSLSAESSRRRSEEAITEGRTLLRNQGDPTREIRDELILVRQFFSDYFLKSIDGPFVDYKGMSLPASTKDERSTAILLDPNLMVQGVARGQFYESPKGEIYGVVGFPNEPERVVVQVTDLARGHVKLKTIKLSKLRRMRNLEIDNLSRPPLVGDIVIRHTHPSKAARIAELEMTREELEAPRAAINRNVKSRTEDLRAAIFTGSMFVPVCLAPITYFCGFVPHGSFIENALLPQLMMTPPFMLAAEFLASYYTARPIDDPTKVEGSRLRIAAPSSKDIFAASQGLRRDPDLWLHMDSLTDEEKLSLGLDPSDKNTNWAVSPSGQLLRIKITPEMDPTSENPL